MHRAPERDEFHVDAGVTFVEECQHQFEIVPPFKGGVAIRLNCTL